MDSGARLVDFLCEPRAPIRVVSWYRRRAQFPTRPARPIQSLSLCLTFDVEQDLGSRGTPDSATSCEPFLRWLTDRTIADGWRTTLFVQGSVVGPHADLLRDLADGHDVGLHGYYHELWGRPLWFTAQGGTRHAVRHERLRRGLEAFDAARLPPPRLWRSPNLVSDRATDDMIAAAGFTIDSSVPSFRGALPIITQRGRLTEIPVSASPRPMIRRRYGVPTWARYDVLNTATLLASSESQIDATIAAIMACQEMAGCAPHLVVLAHPWEFADIGHPGCRRENLDRLVARVAYLRVKYGASLRSLSDIVPWAV